jgi:hypothetical protein
VRSAKLKKRLTTLPGQSLWTSDLIISFKQFTLKTNKKPFQPSNNLPSAATAPCPHTGGLDRSPEAVYQAVHATLAR